MLRKRNKQDTVSGLKEFSVRKIAPTYHKAATVVTMECSQDQIDNLQMQVGGATQ